jgi:hypothetical protein
MVSQSSPQLKRRPGPLAPLGQLGQGLGQGLAYSRKGRTLGSEFDQALSGLDKQSSRIQKQNSKNNGGYRVMSPARLLLLQKLLEDSQGYQVQHNMLESLTENGMVHDYNQFSNVSMDVYGPSVALVRSGCNTCNTQWMV